MNAQRAAAAEMLAERMSNHAECDDHPEAHPGPGCPFCLDRAAYAAWLAAGGRDYRRRDGGPSISLPELLGVKGDRW